MNKAASGSSERRKASTSSCAHVRQVRLVLLFHVSAVNNSLSSFQRGAHIRAVRPTSLAGLCDLLGQHGVPSYQYGTYRYRVIVRTRAEPSLSKYSWTLISPELSLRPGIGVICGVYIRSLPRYLRYEFSLYRNFYGLLTMWRTST